uniref:DNA double-strand break repair nuclease NurA n=1 Tax=Geoglobus ahangari TaxID=113653 RepID=A0A7C4W421_9EURY
MSFEGKLFDNIVKFKEKIEELSRQDIEKIEKLQEILAKNSIKRKNSFDILRDLKVSGIDGSQISPLKDFGIPFGGVQAARVWIHHGKGDYDIKYKSNIVYESNIEFERFKLEMELVRDCLEISDVVFYDGSLSVLYTMELSESLSRAYRREIDSVLFLSEKYETPVIGYVDRSYIKELGFSIYDSYILADYLNLYEFTNPIETKKSPLLAFYFKSNPTLPARIEIPKWCENLYRKIAEIVYAECVMGSTTGYPYILERAHKYAKIDEKEKSAFVRAVKSFKISFKYLSKMTVF